MWYAWIVVLAGAVTSPGDDAAARDDTAADRAYRELLEAFEADPRPAEFAPRFIQFAADHSRDARAVDALAWVVANRRYRAEAARAAALLAERHIESDRLADLCRDLSRVVSQGTERLLRSAFTQSPHSRTRAHAGFYLAALLAEQQRLAAELAKNPSAKARAQQFYGKELTDYLLKLDGHKLETEREKLFEEIVRSYGEFTTDDGPMGKLAESSLFAIRFLTVGRKAPEIDGEDMDGKRLKLSDYRGKVVMLSFWGHW